MCLVGYRDCQAAECSALLKHSTDVMLCRHDAICGASDDVVHAEPPLCHSTPSSVTN